MRSGRALARRGPAADDRQHRQLAADAAGGPGEGAWIAEGLDIEHRELGLLVLFPPGQHVVAGHVVLVADRREGCHADAEPAQVLQQRDPDAAGLHYQAGYARRWRARGERGIQVCRSGSDAEAVRPYQAHPVPAADRQEVSATAAKAGGDHDERVHPAAAAGRGDARYLGRRHRDHGEVDAEREVGRGGEAAEAFHRVAARVDRVDAARESVRDDVVQDLPADGAAAAPGAYHGDRFGEQQVAQARYVRPARPAGHRVEVVIKLVAVVPGQRHDELDHALGEVALYRQAGVGEHALHGQVVWQRLGGERSEAALPGDGDQVLEQQGGDAAAVHFVGHGEGDLGYTGLSRQLMAGNAY